MQDEIDRASSAIARRGGAAKPTKVPKSPHKQRQLEQRAKWIVREWSRCPSYSYAEMIDAVRERFSIGHSSAEHAYSRALEVERDSMLDMNTIERLNGQYWKVYERAISAEKWNAAIRALNGIAQLHGVAAPQRHELNVTTVQQMNHLAIAMTPTQREARKKELIANARKSIARTQPIDVQSVETPAPDSEPMTIERIVEEEFTRPITGDDDGDDDE